MSIVLIVILLPLLVGFPVVFRETKLVTVEEPVTVSAELAIIFETGRLSETVISLPVSVRLGKRGEEVLLVASLFVLLPGLPLLPNFLIRKGITALPGDIVIIIVVVLIVTDPA